MFGRCFVLALVASAPAYAQTLHHVPAGSNLQAALNAASPGDTITLEPGATYVGNYVLPKKSGDKFITIRSAAADNLLPGQGERITPAAAPLLPKLRSPNTMSALRTDPGAHHYRLLFLELHSTVQGASTILALGDGSSLQNSLALVPHSIEVDRVYIHGDATYGAKRGIGLNSASTTIVNSYIAEIKAAGQDSQAIGGWNGPGPYVIHDNYLEAAGENIMFGGADPAIANLVPSDITITHNHLAKPLSWRGSTWTIKNLFELKSAQRVVVDHNLFENNWAAAQTGSAILLKSVNQDGNAPWSVVQDVTFTNNVVRNVSSAVNILGRDTNHAAIEANHITVRNNLFVNVSGSAFGGTGRLLLINGGFNITFDHNTVINDGASTVFADGNPVHGFVFTNNVLLDNGLGIKASGYGEGIATLAAFFPGASVTGNIIANANASAYPGNNSYPALADVGFVHYAGGDYRLAETSLYKRTSPGGSDPGVDYLKLSQPPAAAPTLPDSPNNPGTPGAPAPSAPGPSAPTPSAPGAPTAPGVSSAPSQSPAENTHTPHALRTTVSGTSVALSWTAPLSTTVLQYLVEAGSGPGAADIARIATGSDAPSLTAHNVPHGTYYVRVRAMTAEGFTDASSDAAFIVGEGAGCAGAPATPGELRAQVNGESVRLTWSPAPGSCAPTHYIVEAGSQSGASNLAQITVAGAGLIAQAPPGVYHVRVRAAHAAASSASSNEIVVTVR
jgi:hypothetical protein